ncbi:DNA primase [Burkholderia phage BCSR5]|nr:DNA primase [Burkholderia phage BCSR5]
MSEALDRFQRLSFVREQLQQYSGEKRTMGDSTFVACPFHSEKTPSFRVFHGDTTNSPGYGKCYGCGQGGKWDDIAEKLGLKPFVKGKPKDEFANTLHTALKRLEVEEDEEGVSDFVQERMRNVRKLAKGKRWRGIPTKLLRKIGARSAEFYNEEFDYWSERRLYLPCTVNGELVGYIKARFRKHAEHPSYVNAKGSWSKTHGLFPLDYSVKMAKRIAKEIGKPITLVLVEGQRDALKLILAGIPAVSILGTQSWGKAKCEIIAATGVETVVLFMDGDCAGREATKKIKASLKEYPVLTYKSLALWKMRGSPWLEYEHKKEPSKAAKRAGVSLWDPDSCPDWIRNKIKSRYFS